MSGIACIYNLDGRLADPSIIRRMSAASAYRGPDGIVHWNKGPVALASLLFWTTPEAVREQQPVCDETNNLFLIIDGRVDNRVDLRAALEGNGAVLRSDTDAELVLRAYQCWGEDCPKHIIGDFAFLVWNRRTTELFGARDILGVKPLYYYADAGSFLCASELHQLFECPMVPREPNEGMIGEYLAASPTNCEETLYRGIKRLPPAHCLSVQAGRIRTRRYWNVDPARVLRYKRDDEYAEHFRELLFEAVRCRLRSHGRVGSELSGGLDSSSIVSVAQQLYQDGFANDGGFETFSLLFPVAACDERRYIDSVVQKWHVPANFDEPDVRDVSCYPDQIERYQDFPDYPPSVMHYPLNALAHQKGFRVLLSGDGGDQWLDGSDYHCADLLRGLRFPSLAQHVYYGSGCSMAPRNLLRYLLRYGVCPLLPDKFTDTFWQRSLPDYIEQDFAREINLDDRLKVRAPMRRLDSFASRDTYEAATNGWSAHGNEIANRGLSKLQIEQRYPLHDQRIIDFAMAIPQGQRLRLGRRRFILRNAMRGLLPELVRTRSDKGEFSHVFAEALKALGSATLSGPLGIAAKGWVDSSKVHTRYRLLTERYRMGDPDYWRDVWNLWMVLGVEMWFQTVFLKRGSNTDYPAALDELAVASPN